MGKINNIGLGVIDSKNGIKIYGISAPKNSDEILESLKTDMDITLSNGDVDVSYYGKYDKQALIDATNFYLDLQGLTKDSEFIYIKNGLESLNSLESCEQFELTRKSFKKLEDGGEKIKFFVLETDDNFLLCRINPYNQIIKNKRGFDLGSTEKSKTKFDVVYGIIFPEFVSAVLSKEDHKLSVVSAFDFEKMFNLKVVRMAAAEQIFNEFKSGNYTIGTEKLKVVFEKNLELAALQTRQITYLSSFDETQVSSYSSDKITEAMDHLKDEQKLVIEEEDDKKFLKVNTNNQFKTFVAILHNSILHRMLSDQYEAL
ncbi:hypothetical protein [Weissella confusa]|mgnify:CR=1 FL=1|uniref:hypothetical protein n=1 Tax=Weissella confusa TaxID=1583 RepID=UPI0018F1D429|nr:hypothetical protein [Weissella confusa]MBJ7658763.1 hypothetical protein [Weissella confusa]